MPPRKHHYVPQFLLRMFSPNFDPEYPERASIWWYDKSTQKRKLVPIRSQAFGEKFYTYLSNDVEKNLEIEFFSRLDYKCAILIQRIVQDSQLGNLSNYEVNLLKRLFAIQYLRVPCVRNTKERLLQDLNSQISKDIIWPPYEKKLAQITSEDIKRELLTNFYITIAKCKKEMIDKQLLLINTTSLNPFIISDNPLIIFNYYDNYGINALPGDAFLPISPLLGVVLHSNNSLLAQKYFDDNMIKHLNTLQMQRAERHVFAYHEDSLQEYSGMDIFAFPRLVLGPKVVEKMNHIMVQFYEKK